jgi:mono/diheme cytochrome c family protein
MPRRLTALLLVAPLLAACGGSSSGSGGSSGGGSGGGAAKPQTGAQIFASAGCSGCHTLKAAGSAGQVGPNLDQLKPSEALVRKQVTNGGGGMPPFRGTLSPEQIGLVAKYVSSAAGR